MKKTVLILLILSFAVLSCKKQAAQDTFTGDPAALKATVGISKIIPHPALDAIEQGTMDELKSLGFTNLTYDLQSANGEISTAASIAGKYKSQNVAVSVGIATPMALALANSIKGPIVFSAVTDPVDAELRKNIGREATNITGVSDMTPIKAQFDLIVRLTGAKKLGHVYNAGEANSLVLLHMLEGLCAAGGVELITSTVNYTSEVKQATEVLASKGVDAIYVSTDNIVAAAINSVTTTAEKYGIPVIGADPVTSKDTGALAAYGVDYYKAGRQTGRMVAAILQGTSPGDIPVKFMTEPDELTLYIDSKVANKLGIKIPEDLLK